MTLRAGADSRVLVGRSGPDDIAAVVGDPGNNVARAQLDALAAVVEDLAGQFELRPLLERILLHAVDLLDCSSGSICTVDERTGTYCKEVDLGVACRSGDVFPLTEGVTGEILRAGGPVTFAEYAHVRGGHINSVDRASLHATIGVPIRWAGSVIGSCIVFSRDPGRRFQPADVTLLELFAGHAGVALVNAQMHAHAAELARAEATGLERERVVRDVHDSVARALASVVLHLGSSGSTDTDSVPVLPATGPTRLELARRAAEAALSQTRQSVLGRRPSSPQPPTIEQAIETQVAWARHTGLDIRLVVAGPPRRLPTETVERLYALAHRAISNIVAHADARTARVGLVYRRDEVVLIVQDDGVGFDIGETPRPDGSRSALAGPGLPELTEIAEHAEQLGGHVQIDATPGWGTTIRAGVPYEVPQVDATARTSVLVIEHRPVIRAGLVSLLAAHADSVQVVGEIDGVRPATEATEGAEFDPAEAVLEAYRLLRPSVVLIDAALPSGTPAIIRRLREYDSATAIVALGDGSAGRDLVLAGARAILPMETDAAALERAIDAAARGETLFTDGVVHDLYESSGSTHHQATAFTPREREVSALVSAGLPDKKIAERLHISVKTVEKHVGSALRKTGTHNRTELAGQYTRVR